MSLDSVSDGQRQRFLLDSFGFLILFRYPQAHFYNYS